MPTEERVGTVTHYYPRVHAAVVKLERGDLHVGDKVHIAGNHEDFEQTVTSIQKDHRPIPEAHKGEEVGLLVEQPVHGKAEVRLVRSGPAKRSFLARLFGT